MPLGKLTSEQKGVVTFAYYDVGLLSIGIAYIDSDGQDLSSLITSAIAVLPVWVIDSLRVSQGLQSSIGIIRLLMLLLLCIGLDRVDCVVESHRVLWEQFTWGMAWIYSCCAWKSCCERIQIILVYTPSVVVGTAYRRTMFSLAVNKILIHPLFIILLLMRSRHYPIYWVGVTWRKMCRCRERIMVLVAHIVLLMTTYACIVVVR